MVEEGAGSDRFTPIYFRIQEMVRRSIAQGDFGPGDRLPSETELAREYKTTRVTVRHALSRLEYEGLILRRSGRGTFVADRSSIVSPIDTLKVHSFEQQVAERGKKVSYRDARYRIVPAPADAAGKLSVARGAQLYRMDRLRCINGRTVGFEIRYFTLELGRKVTRPMLEELSAHRFLCEIVGRLIPTIEVNLTAVNATKAVAARLGVKPGMALQLRDNIFRDAAGKIVQYGQSYFRGDIQMEYILGKSPSQIVGD